MKDFLSWLYLSWSRFSCSCRTDAAAEGVAVRPVHDDAFDDDATWVLTASTATAPLKGATFDVDVSAVSGVTCS